MRWAWCGLILAALLLPRMARCEAASSVQSAYLLGCGGCHGIQGRSYAPRVPDLAGQAGYFLCSADGRAYVGRLPNVAYAHLSAARLADVMNYVVFTLGAGSAPQGAAPFTAAEIAGLRARPWATPSLLEMRSHVLDGVLKTCPAAIGLRAYGAAP